MWEIRKYTPDLHKLWDEFIYKSRNATFLFKRGYMDYHSDRFSDCSLMAYRNGKLAAVLPANLSGSTLHSHQGLTYGGWCLPDRGIDGLDYTDLWIEWLNWSKKNGITEIQYKPLPYIYQKMPSTEDIYLLCKTGKPIESNLSSSISLMHNPGFNKLQKRHLAHIPKETAYKEFNCSDTEGVREFHSLLCECLKERHNTSPVHSFEELLLLMNRFPENIVIHAAYLEGKMQAGVCIFASYPCMHCQYIATGITGREKNLLSGLFNEMIGDALDMGYLYFDFGISNEDHGTVLNAGLNRQKTSYGASGVCYSKWIITP